MQRTKTAGSSIMSENSKNTGAPCIGELREREFLVPSYQRGYRWEVEDVEQLLDDIQKNTKKPSRYSLQPVVVASRGDNQWELIDGQQRLTTVNLILLALGEETIPIQYQRHQRSGGESGPAIVKTLVREITSNEDWEQLKRRNRDLDTVDHHHIVNAWLAIKNRLEKSSYRHFTATAILRRTTVIWHKVEAENASSEFLRFNTSKIHLSPCELLKPRFLAKFDPPMNHRSPTEIAAEWDQMESALHDEEFWNFLNPLAAAIAAPTRIALLFDLLAPSPEKTDKEAAAGKGYLDQLPESADAETLEVKWLELRRCFLTLQEWFSDMDIRHLVGFLRWTKTPDKEVELGKLWSEFEDCGRNRYRAWLTSKVEKLLAPDGNRSKWEKASYGDDNNYLQDVLLWLNIRTLPPDAVYPFARHATVKMSLEHIHARASPGAADREQFSQWVEGSLEFLKVLKKKSMGPTITSDATEFATKIQNLEEQIGNLKTEGNAGAQIPNEATETAKSLAGDLEDLVPDPIGDDMNRIWNLALLGKGENSSLSNRFFHQKRKCILDFETGKSDGSEAPRFIPPATVRVFLKAYSETPKDLMIWTSADRKDYKNRINEVITHTMNENPPQ